MSRYRQQLRRDLQHLQHRRENTTRQTRRTVQAGELFDATTGEQLDVISDGITLARVTASRDGRYRIGQQR